MNGSRDNLEKADFGPDLARFRANENFLQKSSFVTFLAHQDLCHHAKKSNERILRKAVTNGRTDERTTVNS